MTNEVKEKNEQEKNLRESQQADEKKTENKQEKTSGAVSAFLDWKSPKLRKRLSYCADAILLLGLCIFAFYVNRDIVIKGLYMDDLYMWSCYGEQSLAEFAFPIGTSTRFRPVYWLATYLQMMIVGNHVNYFVPFNIICNIFAAASLYYMGKKLAKSRILAFGAGLCYLVSRFAYYQIGQALGLMETMALFLAIWILYLLLRYLNTPQEAERTAAELTAIGEAQREAKRQKREEQDKLSMLAGLFASGNQTKTANGKQNQHEASSQNQADDALRAEHNSIEEKAPIQFRFVRGADWRFFLALFLYFLLVFVHERFLSLIPLFYLVLLCRLVRHKKGFRKAYFQENLRLYLAPAIVLLLIVVIRFVCIGTAMPAGTGGTEVTDTFSFAEAIRFALSQVLYLFGINAGPEHLNGLPWENTPVLIKAYTKISILALGIICAMYALVMLLDLGSREKADKKAFWDHFCDALLYLGFIAMCIGCSSVTIRVEMRWVYVSYAAALLYGIDMIHVIVDAYRRASAEENTENASKALQGNNASRALTADEQALLLREQRGNIFRRSSRTVADKLIGPSVVSAILVLVFAVYCACTITTNVFYRTYFPKLYFWPDQLRMNSLAEQTVEKYGTAGVFGKDIYILKNTYQMSQFYGDTFFKPFDLKKKAEGTTVHFVETVDDIPKSKIKSGNILVLEEVPEENAYRDITETVLKED